MGIFINQTFCHRTFHVFKVSKDQRFGGAGLHTGRPKAGPDPLDTEIAFLGHPFDWIQVSHLIRAGDNAYLAAYAQVGIDDYDSVLFSSKGRLYRTWVHAYRVFAMVAKNG